MGEKLQELVPEIYGCCGGCCELPASSGLMLDAIAVKELNRYRSRAEYRLQNSILYYKHLDVTLTSTGLVVEDLGVASETTYYFKYYEMASPSTTSQGLRPRDILYHHPNPGLYLPATNRAVIYARSGSNAGIATPS